ncbi:hypothetical protein PEBR_24411 [Penicillium brasilianum]|uniref:Tubby C-terminal-like domain-containing protein n=1 Tax=Penicillium brasilianum TaxID=104259 RepID=A0A1S9RL77_PENBI|nr:hypothetical protein PEBR_24411 [Penicillium brasilianum]
MSYTSYSEARMSLHSPGFKPKPRKSMRPPERQVALRTESIVPAKTTLVLKPNGNAQSVAAYIITTEEEEEPVYTVSGRKYGDRVCREFHDASGLPLFELHTKTTLGRPYSWFITMPGGGDIKIAEGEPRWGNNKKSMKFSFRNMAPNDAKRDSDKDMTLLISPCGDIMARYDIIDGDRRIAGVYESIHHNDTLALLPKSRRKSLRPAMDVVIVAGVDSSLVAAIAIIMFEWTYGAE